MGEKRWGDIQRYHVFKKCRHHSGLVLSSFLRTAMVSVMSTSILISTHFSRRTDWSELGSFALDPLATECFVLREQSLKFPDFRNQLATSFKIYGQIYRTLWTNSRTVKISSASRAAGVLHPPEADGVSLEAVRFCVRAVDPISGACSMRLGI